MSSSPETPPIANPFDAPPAKDREPVTIDNDDSNGRVRGAGDVTREGGDVTKAGDVKQSDRREDDGPVLASSLRSPMQTRVRRISAELRLSASSNLDHLKKAGKGLSTGLQTMANKLPLPAMPKSLRRRSWHYEEVEQDVLLDPDSLAPDEAKAGGGSGKPKSKSSENLTKKKADGEGKAEEAATAAADRVSDKSFLLRKWEARKNRDQESKGDEKKDAPRGDEPERSQQGKEALSVESIPVVFEPLTLLGQRPQTPVVTVCFDEDSPKQNPNNPFLD